MTAALAPSPTGTVTADLVLVRMALPGKSKPGPKKVREEVSELLGATLSTAEFDALRESLAADKLLVRGRGKSFAITPDGHERAAQVLGLDEMPSRLNWSRAIALHLFPKLAGLAPERAQKLSKNGGLARFLLERRHKMPSTDARALRLALIHDRLKAESPSQPAVTSEVTDPLPVVEEPFDLSVFANTVHKLARVSAPEDRFYDNKVFIAPLWRASQREPNFPRFTLAEFKQRLIEANTEGLLNLIRADLVQVMDPQLVSDSETKHLTATFHFVLIEGHRP